MPFWVSPARSSITNSRCYLGHNTMRHMIPLLRSVLAILWGALGVCIAALWHFHCTQTTQRQRTLACPMSGKHAVFTIASTSGSTYPVTGTSCKTADRGMGRSPLSRRLTHKSQESGVASNEVAATVMDPQQRLNTLHPVNGATRVWPDRLSRGILVCKHVVRC